MLALIVTILLLWATTMTILLVRALEADRRDRTDVLIRHLQEKSGLRAEVQALTEALVRTQGGTYLSPITRNQIKHDEPGKPTEKWYSKVSG